MKIGILGGGQLGYMFLQNALQYPVEIHILDPSANAPCAKHAHRFVKGDFADYQTVVDFGRNLDAIGIEIEHVNSDALRYLKSIGKMVVLDRIRCRSFRTNRFKKSFIPTTEFRLRPILNSTIGKICQKKIRIIRCFKKQTKAVMTEEAFNFSDLNRIWTNS